jgi:hypothetical protein
MPPPNPLPPTSDPTTLPAHVLRPPLCQTRWPQHLRLGESRIILDRWAWGVHTSKPAGLLLGYPSESGHSSCLPVRIGTMSVSGLLLVTGQDTGARPVQGSCPLVRALPASGKKDHCTSPAASFVLGGRLRAQRVGPQGRRLSLFGLALGTSPPHTPKLAVAIHAVCDSRLRPLPRQLHSSFPIKTSGSS